MDFDKMNIQELNSWLQITQKLIDECLRIGGNNVLEDTTIHKKLNKYNKAKDCIVREIEFRLDEIIN